MTMQKKSCYECRALDIQLAYGSVRWGKCALGYPIKMVDDRPMVDNKLLLGKPVPGDLDCPKPRTYNELAKLQNKGSKSIAVWYCRNASCHERNVIESCTHKQHIKCYRCGREHFITGLHINGAPIIALVAVYEGKA